MSNVKRTKEETQALRVSLVEAIYAKDQSVSKSRLMKQKIADLQESAAALIVQEVGPVTTAMLNKEADKTALIMSTPLKDQTIAFTPEQLDLFADGIRKQMASQYEDRIAKLEALLTQPASSPAPVKEEKSVEVELTDEAKATQTQMTYDTLCAEYDKLTEAYTHAGSDYAKCAEIRAKQDEIYEEMQRVYRDLEGFNVIGEFLQDAADGTRKHGNAAVDAITDTLNKVNTMAHNLAYMALKFSHNTTTGAINIMDKGGHVLVNTTADGLEGLAGLIGKKGVEKVKQELAL